MSNITTEAGDRLIQEDVAGVTGASSLNDTRTEMIFTETFTQDPLTNGWLVGDDWTWDSVNGEMDHV